ncbi:Uu.00g144610.m01.CDS01 [Anthostomella pinea]|uniref:Uu.00g144610.m01.CDS01 n=1 Tax=Anthostomella pinea TaxID=933095 RepID=A0AAI8VQX9_9PEZI|nr:Uu.00g144610.m01.CDS01 [Anthostomella pinea]
MTLVMVELEKFDPGHDVVTHYRNNPHCGVWGAGDKLRRHMTTLDPTFSSLANGQIMSSDDILYFDEALLKDLDFHQLEGLKPFTPVEIVAIVKRALKIVAGFTQEQSSPLATPAQNVILDVGDNTFSGNGPRAARSGEARRFEGSTHWFIA